MSCSVLSQPAASAGFSGRRDHICCAPQHGLPVLHRGMLHPSSVGSLRRNAQLQTGRRLFRGLSCRQRCRGVCTQASQGGGSNNQEQDKPFGYTRKDIILLGLGIIAFGYALYYGLQAAGVDSLVAGNYVQLFIFLGIGVGYVSTYLFRVANKEMTYVKQLEDYEEAVMKKRLEEMPETEKERLLQEIEAEKAKKQQAGKP